VLLGRAVSLRALRWVPFYPCDRTMGNASHAVGFYNSEDGLQLEGQVGASLTFHLMLLRV